MMDEDVRRAWQRALRGPDGELLLRGLLAITRPLEPVPVTDSDAVRLYLAGRRAVLFDLLRAAGCKLRLSLEPRDPPSPEAGS